MVAQILLVVSCDDGRELFQRILRILMEEDGWFFSNRDRARHKSLAPSLTNRSDRLLSLDLKPHDRLGDNFGLFRKTVGFLRRFPLSRHVGRTRPHGGLTPLLIFLRSSLMLNEGPSLAVFHFCTKKDEY